MFDAFKTAMDSAQTKADVAVVLGAGTVGFVVDAIVSLHGGLSPGTVAGLSATGALSVKKGVDALFDARHARWQSDQVLATTAESRERVQNLANYFRAQGYKQGEQELQTHLEWQKLGIIDDEKLEQALDAARLSYLGWVDARRRQSPQFP